jgi:hypothetical protein
MTNVQCKIHVVDYNLYRKPNIMVGIKFEPVEPRSGAAHH